MHRMLVQSRVGKAAIVAIGLILLGAGCAFYRQSQPNPPPTSSTTTTQLLDSSSWETFKVDEMGFSFKCPPLWDCSALVGPDLGSEDPFWIDVLGRVILKGGNPYTDITDWENDPRASNAVNMMMVAKKSDLSFDQFASYTKYGEKIGAIHTSGTIINGLEVGHDISDYRFNDALAHGLGAIESATGVRSYDDRVLLKKGDIYYTIDFSYFAMTKQQSEIFFAEWQTLLSTFQPFEPKVMTTTTE